MLQMTSHKYISTITLLFFIFTREVLTTPNHKL